LVAFTIPAATKVNEEFYVDRLRTLAAEFEKEAPNRSTLITQTQQDIIERVKLLSLAAQTPLQKIEYILHQWVAFLIMPLFALSNAGMVIGADFFHALINPVSIGVLTGLVLGKFVGVLFFTWIMVRMGVSSLPERATWSHITGVALLAGVGFTMSLFISGLAFHNAEFVEQAKYGILLASLTSGILGLIMLKSIKVAI